MTKKIIIIGAGPTGLGAAYKLNDLGHDNYYIAERNSYVGGLSASFKKQDFTVDIGGHVLFSHYPYFDKAVADALTDQYLEHVREAWIWIQSKFVPYPFQNNIKYLPKEMILECLMGLINKTSNENSKDFLEWVNSTFGEGIAKYFMRPYNFKVWAHPLEMMSKDWIAERVSVVDIERVLSNVILDKEDSSWGPNNTFRFPLHGGTGAIFEGIANKFRKKIVFNKEVIKVDTNTKTIFFLDGSSDSYDELINTSPLDVFVKNSDLSNQFKNATTELLHSSLYSVGIGFDRPLEKELSTKCWNYFPETNSPFYRVTYLSNYSPNMVQDISSQFLLMAETSYSGFKMHDPSLIVEETINGFMDTKFIQKDDREKIIFSDVIDIDYSYPTPSLNRDKALNVLIPELESRSIYSRGRFGLWRYETGNMDHSFMQGVEVANFILKGEDEKTRYLN